MNFLKAACLAAVSALIAVTPVRVVLAQGVDEQMLLHPPLDSWPGYHGDYSGRRHSPLNQITPQNVKNLSLAWAFQTEQLAQIKSSPLLVNGISPFRKTSGLSMHDPVTRSGITHTRGPRANTSGIAAWRCIKDIFFS
jgi:alcohol dehydrogenase (cytochrome c)